VFVIGATVFNGATTAMRVWHAAAVAALPRFGRSPRRQAIGPLPGLRLAALRLGAAAALMLTATPAFAGFVSHLNIISSSSIGSGTLGTVTLKQIGPNEVDVNVTLAANTKFVTTGSHHEFAFNLNVATAYAVTITSPTGGIFTVAGTNKTVAGTNKTNAPYGMFGYAINCPGCGPGSTHANPGPLTFKVTDVSGIKITNFVANSGGYYFSADVIGPNDGTGVIASNRIPEPASLALLSAGLVGFGLVNRLRKRRRTVAGQSSS
jgi:hypothetical protein